MAIIILSRILDPKNEIGFRILDTKSNVVTGVSYASMLDVLKKGKTKVVNAEFKEGKVVGTNGTLDRYAAVDINNNLLKGKTPYVIISQVGDLGYTVADYTGKITKLSTADTLACAEKYGLANGKVVPKAGKKIISAIGGTYEVETVKAAVKQPSYEKLSIPRGMDEKLADVLSKLYHDLRLDAKKSFNVDITNGALFNSGYYGLTYMAKGFKFGVTTNDSYGKWSFSSPDMKDKHMLSNDAAESCSRIKEVFSNYLANPRERIAEGETGDMDSTDYTKFENCCTAELLGQGIILRVKKDVTFDALLRFPGFDGSEATFKYEGPFDNYGQHSMAVYYKEGTSWRYSWGNSTTMTSKGVWDRNRVVILAMEKLTGKIIYSK